MCECTTWYLSVPWLEEVRKGLGFPAAGVTAGCDFLSVDARSLTQVLWESGKYSTPLSHLSGPLLLSFWEIATLTSIMAAQVCTPNRSKSGFLFPQVFISMHHLREVRTLHSCTLWIQTFGNQANVQASYIIFHWHPLGFSQRHGQRGFLTSWLRNHSIAGSWYQLHHLAPCPVSCTPEASPEYFTFSGFSENSAQEEEKQAICAGR